jgi:hypothetical protein
MLLMQGEKVPLQLARKVCPPGGGGALHALRAEHLQQLVVLDLQVLVKGERVPEFLFQDCLLLLDQLEAVTDVTLPAESLAGTGYQGVPGLSLTAVQGVLEDKD